MSSTPCHPPDPGWWRSADGRWRWIRREILVTAGAALLYCNCSDGASCASREQGKSKTAAPPPARRAASEEEEHAMRIARIVITGDVLRTTMGDANQLPNVRWLHEELAGVLRELTGLYPEVGYRRNAEGHGQAIAAEWYELLGHVPSTEAWAATYAMTAPPALIDALAPD